MMISIVDEAQSVNKDSPVRGDLKDGFSMFFVTKRVSLVTTKLVYSYCRGCWYCLFVCFLFRMLN